MAITVGTDTGALVRKERATVPMTCRRCLQAIDPGDRILREATGIVNHRDCQRLGIVVPRPRRVQTSRGWGAECCLCRTTINKPQPWSKRGGGVVHTDCL